MSKGKDIPVVIGTRGSELALWQARFTQSELAKHGILSELRIIQTKGDATQAWNLSFDKLEGKGFFTKELEEALLNGEIDLAVHSCKDLPTDNPPGLTVAAYSKRAAPFDLLLVRPEKADPKKLFGLAEGAVVGTSSARRKAQLLAYRPDLDLRDLRGNVPTRIGKLRDGQYDAILLAGAGIERLQIDLNAFRSETLAAPMFIPAPAQGVLAFQVRETDSEMIALVECLHDPVSAFLTNIERGILRDFDGGCQMPLGVYAQQAQQTVHVWISQAKAWNTMPKRVHLSFPADAVPDTASVVRRFGESVPKTVFISSDLDSSDHLVRALEAHHYTVHHQSLLDFQPIPFTFDGRADWLFFSSRNAIRYFFDRVDPAQLNDCRLAAVGESTAQAIRELGLSVDFTGDGSGAASADRFRELAGSGKVVFPMAENSLRSVQQALAGSGLELEDLVVYRNIPAEAIESRDEEILVFTSPMNARAYFERHGLLPRQAVVANGPSTSAALSGLGIEHRVSYSPYPWSLTDVIFGY